MNVKQSAVFKKKRKHDEQTFSGKREVKSIQNLLRDVRPIKTNKKLMLSSKKKFLLVHTEEAKC